MSCPIKVKGNTIELTMHTSCYCVLDLLCTCLFFTGAFALMNLTVDLSFNQKTHSWLNFVKLFSSILTKKFAGKVYEF